MTSSPPAPGRRALTRRSLLHGGLAAGGLGLAATTSGCGTPFAAGVAGTQLAPGTVTFWNLFGGGDGARLQLMLEEYERQHGGPSSLQSATFAWGNPYYTKVSLATLGDKPPDVAVAHATRATNLARAGLLSEITDEVLALVDLSPDDFTPKVWEAVQVEGRAYAIPLDTHPFVLFYNKGVCREAGLLDADDQLVTIEGTEQWEAALTAAKEVTGAYGASVATVSETATPWRFFQTLYSQRTGSTPFLAEGGTELTFNEELVADTLAYLRSLTESGLMPETTDYAGSQTLMFTGQSAFYLQGEWEITTAQSVDGLEFGMVPVPQLFDQPACQADSHAFILPTMERSPDQLQRAMGFVKSMLDQSLAWAKGGHVPAYLPALRSSEYQELVPQSGYVQAADYAVYDSPAWYSGSGSNFETIVGAQIGLVMQGIATPQEAIASMRSQLQTYADTADPLS
ncbi:extracellular solute-binding protein [Kineococcus sp. SYSU DK018]|uniref:extracellular solute-binding protein n=1 Tax=Kineococcus sp. SYSU DK018 TaxID=3383139 RepID=UPI003D7D095F